MWPADYNNTCYPVTAYHTTIGGTFQDSSTLPSKMATFCEPFRHSESQSVFRGDSVLQLEVTDIPTLIKSTSQVIKILLYLPLMNG